MAEIRYLIVSDLHLGAANSILTALTPDNKLTIANQANGLLTQLARGLSTLASSNPSGVKPTLILNGDCLELALTGMNDAAMCFQRLLDLTSGPAATPGSPRASCFGETSYLLPGNHDHHLWNLARETQYIENYILTLPPGTPLAPEFYATNMFLNAKLNPVRSGFLNAVAAQSGLGACPTFFTVYPNLALFDAARDRGVILHHGHYVESMYSAISNLNQTLFPDGPPPAKIWDLESDNGAWIDFFWSTLGRSGQAGQDVELIYDKMQSKPAFSVLLKNLAKGISPGIPPQARLFAPIKDWFLRQALGGTIGKYASREAQDSSAVLSMDAATGLNSYVEEFVLAEIARGNDGKIPRDLTFLFGHTHKPFEKIMPFKGFPQPLKVLNSGGWVVDSLATDPLHGGAVIVVDDELNVASVRIYQEGATAPMGVTVQAANLEDNPLYADLKRTIDPNAEPWKTLSTSAAQSIKDHRENLAFRVRSRA